jgi:hypothetical protein
MYSPSRGIRYTAPPGPNDDSSSAATEAEAPDGPETGSIESTPAASDVPADD